MKISKILFLTILFISISLIISDELNIASDLSAEVEGELAI